MPLISSAAGGKRAAPKIPARRRQAAVAQQAAAVASSEVSNPPTTTDAPLPSPPPTQDKSTPRTANDPHTQSDAQTQSVAPPVEATQPQATRSTASSRIEQDADVPQHIESSEQNRTSVARERSNVAQSTHIEGPIIPLDPRLLSQSTSTSVRASEPELQAGRSEEPQRQTQIDRLDGTYGEVVVSTDGDQAQGEVSRRAGHGAQVGESSQLSGGEGRAPDASAKKRQNQSASSIRSPRPVKRKKMNSTRSNMAVQTVQNDDTDEPQRITTASQTFENQNDQRQTQTISKPSKRAGGATAGSKRKRKPAKSAVRVNDSGDAEPKEVPEIPEEPIQRRRRKQQKRSDSNDAEGHELPEQDPELHEIDPETLSMFSLSHDTVHGKTSERERKMAAINWDEVAQKRKDEACRIAAGQQNPDDAEAVPSIESADKSTGTGAADRSSRSGNVQFTMDAAGNIIADESSLQINRQEAFEAAEARGDPVEDVNDLTIRINRSTWVNSNRREPADRAPPWKSKSDPWSEEDTDKFYDALRMFGTDFNIISKMFDGKNRKHLKLKFTREERLDPVRLNNALMGKDSRTMSLEHYARETGNDVSFYTKYDGVDHAMTKINAEMNDERTALTAAAEEEALAEKQRADREKQAALENKQSTKKARRKRGTMGGTLSGAPDAEE